MSKKSFENRTRRLHLSSKHSDIAARDVYGSEARDQLTE